MTIPVTQRQLDCAALFIKAGYHKTGAAVWVGDFVEEDGAGLMTKFRFKTGLKTDHGSESLAQWREDRLYGTLLPDGSRAPDGLIPWCHLHNLDPETLEGAVAFAIWECGEKYPDLDKAMRAGGNITELMVRLVKEYERPNMAVAHIYDIRIPHAVEIDKRLQLIDAHAGAQNDLKSAHSAAGGVVALGTAAAAAHQWAGMPMPVVWASAALVIGVLLILSGKAANARQKAEAAAIAIARAPVVKTPDPAPVEMAAAAPAPPISPAPSSPDPAAQFMDAFFARLEAFVDAKFSVADHIDSADGLIDLSAYGLGFFAQ